MNTEQTKKNFVSLELDFSSPA